MAAGQDFRIRFDHVALAVPEIDPARAFLARYFPLHDRNMKMLSEQVSGALYWEDFFLGGFPVELIQDPPGQDGFVNQFVRKRGGGLHHLAFELDNFGPMLEKLRADGVRIVDEQVFEDGNRIFFISPRAAFGTLIQVWQMANYDAPRMKPVIDRKARFDHVAIAVRDIDKGIEFFQRYFPARIVREKQINRSTGNSLVAQLEIAGGKLELIQSPGHPVEDDFVARFIERRGEGLHHITIDLKEFDATLAKLKQDAVRVVGESKNRHGRRQFFISPRAAYGALIQVWDGIAE
ncbi:MAG TPA: VOC family protein [Candidatus Binataceae bacterium]|nr:VOC family protein [Candidatus Binataceae bacterium]